MNSKKIRVLIFPAGAENALEIYDAIKDNLNIEVFGASGKSDHASYLYDTEHYFEDNFYITARDFIPKFRELLTKLKIDVLIPTHDTIALFFAKNRALFPTKILTASYHTALICREKRKTFLLFGNYNFCPKVYNQPYEVSKTDYPIFSKPNIGEGGKGIRIIKSEQELSEIEGKDMILCEYLPGEEYTIDCFTDSERQLKYIGMRTRERIQMGIAFRSCSLDTPEEIINMAQIINKYLEFIGGWSHKVNRDKMGNYKLLEISCRMAGTMTLHRHKGINFSLLGIFEIMGIKTDFCELPCKISLDRALYALYRIDYKYEHIYLDYDDTVTKKENVNENVIKLLYQCKRKGIRVTLLTRHAGDLMESFENYCLHPKLFDEIIHITFEQEKSDYINPQKAIFIDNSFTERKRVTERFGIPVFDVDAVDALLSNV